MMEKYAELFKKSSFDAGLADDGFNVVFKTERCDKPTKKQLRAAVKAPLYLPDKTAVLHCDKVRDGYFFRYEHKDEITAVNERLSETGDYLIEESAVISEAAALEETRRRTTEQNRLFDGISKSLQPQLNLLDEILSNLPDDEAGFCRQMKYAGILGAFVKRFSNLLLFSASDTKTDSAELYLCINESFTYLRLLDVSCYADIQQGIALPVSIELLMYGLFESVVESVLTTLPAVLVTLKNSDDGLFFYIEAANEEATVDNSFFEAAQSAGFTLDTERSDGCFFAVLRSGGGDSV